MQKLLGDDIVFFVHENEREEYEKAGAVNVDCHTCNRLAAIRNVILDRYLFQNPDAEAVVMCDDDLVLVNVQTQTKVYKIRDKDLIRAIIDNGVVLAVDSGCGLFGWSRQPHPRFYMPNAPFFTDAPTIQCFVCTRNSPRCDEKLVMFDDLDLVMSSLKSNRFTLMDGRFYFQFEPVYHGVGGNQGVRTNKTETADKKYMKEKWGKYVYMGQSNLNTRRKNSVSSMGIRVSRKNPLVSTK